MIRRRKFLLGASLFLSTVLTPVRAAEPQVSSIESPTFDKAQLARIAGALGISVGHPLDPRRLDEGLRSLFEHGEIQALFVESEPHGEGVAIKIRGEQVRVLHELRFTDVDPAIVDEVRRKIEMHEGQATSLRTFALLRERVRDAYERRGYHFADVKIAVHDLPEGKLADVEVSVSTHQATEVTKVQVVGGNPTEDATLLGVVTLKAGDRFSQGKVEDSIEAINHYLRANQYPTSKVEDTQLHYSADHLQVEVQFVVKLGKRYQFQFAGNRAFTDVQLRALLTPEVLSQSDATERIARLVEDKYRSLGFYFCKVKPESIVDDFDKVNIIRFNVDEGHRVRVDKIDFSGGEELGNQALEKLFYENSPGVLARHVYWEDGVADTLRGMTKRLNAIGYEHPSLTGPKAVFSEDHKGVQLYFDADLGPKTVVSSVDVQGASQVSQGELTALMPLKPGEPLDPDKVRLGRAAILAHYNSKGFVDAKIVDKDGDVEMSRDQRQAVIPVRIQEGKRYKIGKIHLEGNQKTKPEVILREMKVKEGEDYDPSKVKRSEQDIALLGLFSRVEVIPSPDPNDPQTRDLRIVVHETDPGLGEVGVGAVYEDPRLRVRGFVAASYRNLFGLNQTLSWRNQLSLPLTGSTGPLPFVEYGSILGYRAPQPFDLPLDFSAQVGVTQYEVSTIGPTLNTQTQISTVLERKISDSVTLRYRLYKLERDKLTYLSPVTVSGQVYGGINISTIGSTGPGIVYDRRDDIFNPRHGSYHTLDVEFAHPYLLSQENIAFVMGVSRNSFYVPLFSPFRFILFVGLGAAHSLFPDQPLPQVRLVNDLALGGLTSLRGFTVKRFQPAASAHDAGYYNVRGEIDTDLVPDFSVALFADSGQLFSNDANYFRHDSIGIGLRYKTPVGPVVVDIAQGMGTDREAVKFYFTVGSL